MKVKISVGIATALKENQTKCLSICASDASCLKAGEKQAAGKRTDKWNFLPNTT
jgi:positive regulator of sigma E activity